MRRSVDRQCALCGSEDAVLVAERGWQLLTNPRLNKGSAFTGQERDDLGIEGLLPPHIATLEEQMERVHGAFVAKGDPLNQHIYLRSLQDRNETLFYATLLAHLEEYMPIIYTPTVATAVEEFSHIFRASRGIYISPENIDEIDIILANIPCHDIAIIVATDNEGILGIGDQGVGGMGIPIGKLSLYTAAGGICPARCLPVCLDVGTDNQALLDDPLYLGYRGPRLIDEEYYPFLDKFVAGIKRNMPQAILQWEDFSRDRAFEVLRRYEDQHPSFNDDVQGTSAMVHAATLGALAKLGQRYRDQVFAVLGAGAAGAGIARSTARALIADGLTEAEAWQHIYVLDSRGLVTSDRGGLDEYKQVLARDPADVAGWTLRGDGISLADVIANAKPTVLYGLSGHPGTIQEPMVRAMSEYCEHPIIFPMSNPTANCEAIPTDLLAWSDGRAIVATGSPFGPAEYNGKQYRFSQANNVAVFPGVGLGAMFCGARAITADMLFVAGEALHAMTEPDDYEQGLVLPPNRDLREMSIEVAAAVASQAWQEGVAAREKPAGDLAEALRQSMYVPRYRPYVAQ
ncbi:MAG: NAD-dependent malic enzyme [Armatimonadota bacterium]